MCMLFIKKFPVDVNLPSLFNPFSRRVLISLQLKLTIKKNNIYLNL